MVLFDIHYDGLAVVNFPFKNALGEVIEQILLDASFNRSGSKFRVVSGLGEISDSLVCCFNVSAVSFQVFVDTLYLNPYNLFNVFGL